MWVTTICWFIIGLQDEDLLYTGRRRRRAVNNDDISSEFSLAKPAVNRPEQMYVK